MEKTQPGSYGEKRHWIRLNIKTSDNFCSMDLSRTRCEVDCFLQLTFTSTTLLIDILVEKNQVGSFRYK